MQKKGCVHDSFNLTSSAHKERRVAELHADIRGVCVDELKPNNK